jgi:hypothetical protein
VIKQDHIINMARDVKDITKPAKDYFGVGQVYQVKITNLLKGNETETIYVVQEEGFLGTNDAKTEIEILKSKERYNFVPMSQGKVYLMFLRPMLSYPEEKLFVGIAQPWRFDASDPARVVPESPWKQANLFFPPQSLDTFIEQIEHPDSIISSPYPPPQSLLSQSAYPPPHKTKP